MKMPWWLLLLRLLLATALILAVARPLLNPQADLPGRGPLMLVIDDGWSSAPGWTTRIAHAERLIQRAERASRPVVLTGTAPPPLDAPAMRKRRACGPTRRAPSCAPSGPSPGRPTAPPPSTAIDQMQVDPGAYVVWLSDGLEDEGAAKLTERLRRFDGLQVVLPDQATTPLLLLPPAAEGRDLKVQALRPVADGPRKVAVQASDEQGRVVARIDLDFAATATKGEGVLPAPPELRNRMARLDIEAQGGAGSTVLLDERSSPPAGLHPGRAADRQRPAAAAGGLLPRARARSLCQPDDRRSRDGADAQHRRAADPRRRRTLGQRPRGDRQVDRARRRGRALRRPQPRQRQRPAGADAAAPGRPRAGRRHELGPADGAGRVPGQQPLPRHPDPQGRAHLPAGAGRADARPRRQDLGAPGRRHAAGHRREARPGLSRADPHHRQHRLEQHGALRPVREHAAAAGDPVARRRRRRRQQGAEAVAHARRLRPPGRAAGRRADAAGRRRRDLQAQADHAARPLRRRERPGRLQHRRPCARAQAAGAAGRRRDRQAVAKAARPTCRAGSCWPPSLLLLADLFISLWLRGLLGRARCASAAGGAPAPAALLLGARGLRSQRAPDAAAQHRRSARRPARPSPDRRRSARSRR